ncbi:hypothetical protein [Actinoplanes sp. NPDC051494]|uniref:hypothetical protein n=1 Tax=Actinoplanes sp. NPDC051494 TaxID=3363907 RepID=UPI0037A0B75F
MASDIATSATAPAVRNGGGALAAPAGPGAVGTTNLSMVRMVTLLDQALKALLILQDVGTDLLQETTTTEDLANHLTASFGERISLEQLRVIAGMLTQIAEGSLQIVGNGHDAVRTALLANFQVAVVQEQLHSLGADGAYVDSQRRAG